MPGQEPAGSAVCELARQIEIGLGMLLAPLRARAAHVMPLGMIGIGKARHTIAAEVHQRGQTRCQGRRLAKRQRGERYHANHVLTPALVFAPPSVKSESPRRKFSRRDPLPAHKSDLKIMRPKYRQSSCLVGTFRPPVTQEQQSLPGCYSVRI